MNLQEDEQLKSKPKKKTDLKGFTAKIETLDPILIQTDSGKEDYNEAMIQLELDEYSVLSGDTDAIK